MLMVLEEDILNSSVGGVDGRKENRFAESRGWIYIDEQCHSFLVRQRHHSGSQPHRCLAYDIVVACQRCH
jgi:hypothetical protein